MKPDGRVNALREQRKGAPMATTGRPVPAAARLHTAAIRIEARIANRCRNTQASGGRVHDVHIERISGGDALVRSIQMKERPSRIQSHDERQFTDRDSLAGDSGHMGAQTVSDQMDVAESSVAAADEKLDKRRHHIGNDIDTSTCLNIIERIRDDLPVNGNQIDVVVAVVLLPWMLIIIEIGCNMGFLLTCVVQTQRETTTSMMMMVMMRESAFLC